MPETVPDGFAPHFKKSKVTDPWEPLYSRELPEAVQIGLRLRDVHCNSRGFVHGGVIAALADNAMGLSFVRVFKATVEDPAHPATGAVTVGLGVDYVATAKLGQWLQIEPRVVKAGRSLGFVDALVTADGEVVARANATFRLTS
jgi:acyl-coenzyme A thioesterase PaaI-like protein